ncbi:hypothetical protein [Ruficoccus sp. ZRK36]|uniref:hypothetical protein n=1 Tax=Ruficoccus sp. ZRK36 TaxID=2866311 RepID=UPI001C72EC6D|nr:hypothetical protein [Ruficoccus sp. ZRK36]QYY35300.1 hypothetical protein K0V07_13490 [Ruficoccus sp. ZRK36]
MKNNQKKEAPRRLAKPKLKGYVVFSHEVGKPLAQADADGITVGRKPRFTLGGGEAARFARKSAAREFYSGTVELHSRLVHDLPDWPHTDHAVGELDPESFQVIPVYDPEELKAYVEGVE